MSPIAPVLARLGADVADLSAGFGRRVDPATLGVSDRTGLLQLDEPGLISANRACHMIRAADGWIAANLAREDDQELIPAWLRIDPAADHWAAIERVGATPAAAERRSDRRCRLLLGLPVAGGRRGRRRAWMRRACGWARPTAARAPGRRAVVDLSALWAGPMCGAILAEMGAEVVKVESASRPDPTRATMPEFFRRLNGGKAELALRLRRAAGPGAAARGVRGRRHRGHQRPASRPRLAGARSGRGVRGESRPRLGGDHRLRLDRRGGLAGGVRRRCGGGGRPGALDRRRRAALPGRCAGRSRHRPHGGDRRAGGPGRWRRRAGGRGDGALRRRSRGVLRAVDAGA